MIDYETVVVDGGSSCFKAGFAGDALPNTMFSAAVGTLKYKRSDIFKASDLEKRRRIKEKQQLNGATTTEDIDTYTTTNGRYHQHHNDDDRYIGNEAQTHRGILRLDYPINNGVVTNWEDLENMWTYLFQNQMQITTEDFGLLMTESMDCSKQQRERITQIIFETFEFKALTQVPAPLLTLYSEGKHTGLVVESGEHTTWTVPIYEGYAVGYAAKRIEVGGSTINDYLQTILNQSPHHQYRFKGSSSEREIIRGIKEDLCYVAEDYSAELEDSKRYFDEIAHPYTLPDGQVITVASERFQAVEIMFSPSLINGSGQQQQLGVHQVVANSLVDISGGDSNDEIQNEMKRNIVLGGGNTMFEGFADRLKRELRSLANTTVPAPIQHMQSNGATSGILGPLKGGYNITATTYRKFSAWMGGSLLGQIVNELPMCMPKEYYDEYGPNYAQMCHRAMFLPSLAERTKKMYNTTNNAKPSAYEDEGIEESMSIPSDEGNNHNNNDDESHDHNYQSDATSAHYPSEMEETTNTATTTDFETETSTYSTASDQFTPSSSSRYGYHPQYNGEIMGHAKLDLVPGEVLKMKLLEHELRRRNDTIARLRQDLSDVAEQKAMLEQQLSNIQQRRAAQTIELDRLHGATEAELKAMVIHLHHQVMFERLENQRRAEELRHIAELLVHSDSENARLQAELAAAEQEACSLRDLIAEERAQYDAKLEDTGEELNMEVQNHRQLKMKFYHSTLLAIKLALNINFDLPGIMEKCISDDVHESELAPWFMRQLALAPPIPEETSATTTSAMISRQRPPASSSLVNKKVASNKRQPRKGLFLWRC